jgi:hypothetical protein
MLRREARIAPFVFSVLLHALAAVLIVTGLAAPADESAKAKLAELFPQPEAVNVRLVDASEAPELKPAEARLLSERDSRAADHAPDDLPEGAPFNRGETSVPSAAPGEGGRDSPRAPEASAARPPAEPAERTRAEEPRRSAEADGTARSDAPRTDAPPGAESATAGDLALSDPARKSTGQASSSTLGDSRLAIPRRDLAVPQTAAPPGALKPPGTGRRGLPQVDNRLSRARFDGEFSLSTYAWDYAPYMSRLKSQIEDYTWTILPSAFWYGIAAWATQVRFTILPDGRLESITITGHEGVLELRHVASDAVTGSADFEPLPTGFPDPKLTIVGNFYFNEFPPAREAADSGASPPAGGRGGGGGEGGTGASRQSAADEPPGAPAAGQGGAVRGDS